MSHNALNHPDLLPSILKFSGPESLTPFNRASRMIIREHKDHIISAITLALFGLPFANHREKRKLKDSLFNYISAYSNEAGSLETLKCALELIHMFSDAEDYKKRSRANLRLVKTILNGMSANQIEKMAGCLGRAILDQTSYRSDLVIMLKSEAKNILIPKLIQTLVKRYQSVDTGRYTKGRYFTKWEISDRNQPHPYDAGLIDRKKAFDASKKLAMLIEDTAIRQKEERLIPSHKEYCPNLKQKLRKIGRVILYPSRFKHTQI